MNLAFKKNAKYFLKHLLNIDNRENRPRENIRRQVASQYISGNGIEIGPRNIPLKVPDTAKVRYVDIKSLEEQIKENPKLGKLNLVDIDIIDDGEILSSIASSSLDFVIANHMIEHCHNPIGTIENWLRVLKVGGILFMAVPDKRYTFDRNRSLTSLEHLINDYSQGSEMSNYAHYEDWLKNDLRRENKQISAEEFNVKVQRLIKSDRRIHFHVWTILEFSELLVYCIKHLSLPFNIELIQNNPNEFIVVLRKTGIEAG